MTDLLDRGVGRSTGGHLADTLVIGLGNPILADDGVGWRVIEALRERRLAGELETILAGVDLELVCVGGVALMEELSSYRRAIIVDAILEPDGEPGRVWCQPLRDVETRTSSHLDSSHDAPLLAALAAGRAMGAAMPDDIEVVGVTITGADTFSEELSAPVAAAVDVAVDLILDRLR